MPLLLHVFLLGLPNSFLVHYGHLLKQSGTHTRATAPTLKHLSDAHAGIDMIANVWMDTCRVLHEVLHSTKKKASYVF